MRLTGAPAPPEGSVAYGSTGENVLFGGMSVLFSMEPDGRMEREREGEGDGSLRLHSTLRASASEGRLLRTNASNR